MRRLRSNGDPEAMDKILQDECRRRASAKLAATLLCPDFRFPTALSAEQCTSDEVAEFHSSLIPDGASVIDLTAGLGIDAFHCARKASRVLAMDIDPVVAAAIGENAKALSLYNVEGVCADCRRWLAENPDCRFDVAFIDPARRGSNGQRLFGLHDCNPDVVEMLPEIARHVRRLIVKASPMLDITRLLREEGLRPAQLIIVGTRAECKELVLVFDFDAMVEEPAMKAVTVGGRDFEFTLTRGEPTLADPEPSMLIGEPWPAVMKSCAFNQIPGARLHLDTHLYVLTNEQARTFPGNIYRIVSVAPFSSSLLKKIAKAGGVYASVAAKNFPISADELKKRLKARENSSKRIIGVTSRCGRLLLELEIINFAL